MLSLVTVLPAAAQAKKTDKPAADAKQGAEKKYHIDGTIKSVSLAAHSATIDAKAIPGFMGAMAMPYMFKDSVALSKLKVGDHITGDLVVTGGKTLVDNVKVEAAAGAAGAMKKDSTKKS